MEKTLAKTKLSAWVAALDGYDIFTPAFADNVWNYARANTPDDVCLDHPNTVHSIKSIVFPQREVFFKFSQSKGEAPVVTEVEPKGGPAVVFGVRPCDGKAQTLNDKVFGGEFEDPYYWTRRNRTVSVGLSCNKPPSIDCFCLAVGGSPSGEEGLDILMTDLGDQYFVKALTEKGQQIVALGGAAFADASTDDQQAAAHVHEIAAHKHQRDIPGLGVEKMAQNLEADFDSPLWDEVSKACLTCGICTFLCPTCHCFDMNDEVSCSSPCKGERVRTWDSCQFPNFTMHTTGHNPRDDKGSRTRQRMCHKFRYFPDNYDTYQCTGCGRCISECPVGIDIVQVMNRVNANAK
jgi:NAD-dependent dihydropyrimidine dehydrogenase PreA subunit